MRIPDIEALQSKIRRGDFELSKHALDQSIIRGITTADIRAAFDDGEVIEAYPDDKYGPSCLVLGTTSAGRPLHVVCSFPTRSIVKIITLYEPDPLDWIGFRRRRQ